MWILDIGFSALVDGLPWFISRKNSKFSKFFAKTVVFYVQALIAFLLEKLGRFVLLPSGICATNCTGEEFEEVLADFCWMVCVHAKYITCRLSVQMVTAVL